MKIIFLVLSCIVVICVLSVLIVDAHTSAVIYEDNPCKIIECTVPLFGFFEQKAVQIGTTKDGYAVCKCPHEPYEQVYYVSVWRKY